MKFLSSMAATLVACSFAAAAHAALPALTQPLPGIYQSTNYIVSTVGACQGVPGYPPLPAAGSVTVSHIYYTGPKNIGSLEYFDFVDTQTPDPTQNNSVIMKVVYPANAAAGAKTWSGSGTATIYASGPAFNFPAAGISLPVSFTVTYTYTDALSFTATDVTSLYSSQAALNAGQPYCTLNARTTNVYVSGLL